MSLSRSSFSRQQVARRPGIASPRGTAQPCPEPPRVTRGSRHDPRPPPDYSEGAMSAPRWPDPLTWLFGILLAGGITAGLLLTPPLYTNSYAIGTHAIGLLVPFVGAMTFVCGACVLGRFTGRRSRRRSCSSCCACRSPVCWPRRSCISRGTIPIATASTRTTSSPSARSGARMAYCTTCAITSTSRATATTWPPRSPCSAASTGACSSSTWRCCSWQSWRSWASWRRVSTGRRSWPSRSSCSPRRPTRPRT